MSDARPNTTPVEKLIAAHAEAAARTLSRRLEEEAAVEREWAFSSMVTLSGAAH